jgi:hypothetical protein
VEEVEVEVTDMNSGWGLPVKKAVEVAVEVAVEFQVQVNESEVEVEVVSGGGQKVVRTFERFQHSDP